MPPPARIFKRRIFLTGLTPIIRRPTKMNRPTTDSTMSKIDRLFGSGRSARDIIREINPDFHLGPELSDNYLWKLLLEAFDDPVGRKKLPHYNTIDDAVRLIERAKKIVVLSGAGISTSAGIPDFRSRDGIYRQNPNPFYQFAKALYPGQFEPTIGHRFIKYLEKQGKLLKNYTQNIDTLERQAGITKVIECHGSFAKATCTACRCKEDSDGPNDGLGVMKPDIVFFGEPLGDEFHSNFEQDKNEVDLLIVIGSSLKVKPVALIPRRIKDTVPQIFINREPLDHFEFDIELYGNCDEIIQELCLRLDAKEMCVEGRQPFMELEGPEHILDLPPNSFLHLKPNFYLFPGFELTDKQYDDLTKHQE